MDYMGALGSSGISPTPPGSSNPGGLLFHVHCTPLTFHSFMFAILLSFLPLFQSYCSHAQVRELPFTVAERNLLLYLC